MSLRAAADERGVDLLLVDSGDIVDGNGSVDPDTSGIAGQAARQLLKQIGYGVVTPSNHEMRVLSVAKCVYEQTAQQADPPSSVLSNSTIILQHMACTKTTFQLIADIT